MAHVMGCWLERPAAVPAAAAAAGSQQRPAARLLACCQICRSRGRSLELVCAEGAQDAAAGVTAQAPQC